jgi:hypothetical protein
MKLLLTSKKNEKIENQESFTAARAFWQALNSANFVELKLGIRA